MLIDLLESSKAIGLCPMGILSLYKYNSYYEIIMMIHRGLKSDR